MKKPQKFFAILFIPVLLLASLAAAQQPIPESSLPIQMQSPAGTQTAPSPSGQQKMDKMADSVTKMSEMCQMMMQKEMAGAPYKMAAGIGLGALLLIAPGAVRDPGDPVDHLLEPVAKARKDRQVEPANRVTD